MKLNGIHHIAIICSDYERSKSFYMDVLGFSVVREVFRADRNSFKLDLSLSGKYCIELFSFPEPPKRLTWPEAAGLRHIAFEVDNIQVAFEFLQRKNIHTEPLRTDEFTAKKFFFISDPDGLPIEIYER